MSLDRRTTTECLFSFLFFPLAFWNLRLSDQLWQGNYTMATLYVLAKYGPNMKIRAALRRVQAIRS